MAKSKSRICNIWSKMKQRCFNKKNKSYDEYGGRGISICEKWKDNHKNFKEWALKNGYRNDLSIDRINPNGNYEPSNCRWTTNAVQQRNTRLLRKSNKTGFRGVSFEHFTNKFRCGISVNGVTKQLGRFDSAIDAAMAYDKYVIENNLEHTKNFGVVA